MPALAIRRGTPRERHTAAARPGPVYVSRRDLAGPVLRFLLSLVKYRIRRRSYPHFRLRALLALPHKKMVQTWRLVRLGRHYYGASLRTPRWPSPAFDRMIAGGGMNLAPELIPHKHHIDTAILGITCRCDYACEHCYDAPNRAEVDVVSTARWVEVVRQLESNGVSVIVLSGGEPMLRYADVLTILEQHDARSSDIHLHSSGAGVTPERARALAARGLVAAGIGLDFPDAVRHDRFRGTPGAFRDARDALTAFGDAGVFTYTNLCLTKDLLQDGGLYAYLDLARDLRVGAVQLLEPKPCGRYGSRDPHGLFTDEDRARVLDFFREVNRPGRYAGHPPVAYTAHFERPENFGCLMAGLAHLAIDSHGEMLPCTFLPVSLGNILREDVDVLLGRMRSAGLSPRYQDCPAVALGRSIALQRERTGRPVVPFEEFRPQWNHCLSRD